MGIVLKNNAHTVLSANMSSLDTTIYVNDVSSFPSLGVGEYFYCTIESPSGAYEIVKVTQVNTASFNITRAQETTIAVPFSAGARVELRVTVQALNDQFQSAANALIGITLQGWDPDLDTWAAITRAAGFDTFVTTPSSVNLKALITDETGSGALVFATSPTLVTPLLGTPTSGILTNCTGLPISTGISGLAAGIATFLATPSSANLITAVTDETGTGALVFATSPTFITPLLGTPTSGTLTNCTGLPISTGVSGLAAGAATFLATPTSANLIALMTDETGTGALVFATSPTFITPLLGTPTSGTLTNCTGLPISTGISGLAAGAATFLATPTSANLIALMTDETGTGANVFATSPTLVTPLLGTPTSGTLTNCTGLPISTGVSGLAAGVATFLATPSSANLITAVTDETGTGALVFANTPTLVTPVLGAATATSITASGLLQAGSGSTIGLSTDVLLNRDAADVLALRRSTTAQAYKVYNTFTDASNYERATMTWNTNVLELGTEKAGTGSTRNVKVLVGGTNQLDYGVTNSGKWTSASDVIVPAGKEQIWVPAAALKPRTTNGCSALANVETTTNKVNIETCDFDPTTQQFAQFTVRVPKHWGTNTFTAKFYWKHAATSTNFGVVWNIAAGSFGDNEALDTAFGTAQQVADTGGTTNNHYITAATSAVTIANLTAEEMVYFQVARVPADASDTMAINAGLIGIMLEFTTTGALNDN